MDTYHALILHKTPNHSGIILGPFLPKTRKHKFCGNEITQLLAFTLLSLHSKYQKNSVQQIPVELKELVLGTFLLRYLYITVTLCKKQQASMHYFS